MDGVESAVPPPQAPPPPQRPAARVLALFEMVFVSAVLSCIFAFAWLSSAANAAFIAARWGYGGSSRPAAFTKMVALSTSMLLGLFLHAIVIIVLSMWWHLVRRSRRADARLEVREVAAQRLVPGAVLAFLIVVFTILAMGGLMQIISRAKGDRDVERVGFILVETVIAVLSLVFCLVTYPYFIVQLVAVVGIAMAANL